MCIELDRELAENLRRWVESGQPRRWVESRQGRWEHHDWLALLEELWGSEFWPLEPAAVGAVLEDFRRLESNLRLWRESALPRAWVESRQGRWTHADWLGLLEDLRASEFWPLEPEAVGRVLEQAREQRRNLARWRESGQARAWVEAHGGRWNHVDWLCLVEALQESEFWPLSTDAVGEVLEEFKTAHGNLQRWRASGAARSWVEARGGTWNHQDWLALVDDLRASEYWPLAEDRVGQTLEEIKLLDANLRRWRESGQPRRWVEGRQGRWLHSDWLALLADLRESSFWPVDVAAVGAVLEDLRKAARAPQPPRTRARGWGEPETIPMFTVAAAARAFTAA